VKGRKSKGRMLSDAKLPIKKPGHNRDEHVNRKDSRFQARSPRRVVVESMLVYA